MIQLPRNFIIGAFITSLAGILIMLVSHYIGRVEFFLMLNADLGTGADFFFRYWTLMGDGIIWVPVMVLFFIFRKQKLPLVLFAILFSTLISQSAKNFLFTGSLRPTAVIENRQLVHTVPGVELYSNNSFPSGHTTTAFCVFLLACLFINNKWVRSAMFLGALGVGYSRVYLAEHFPLDVGGGMITAVMSLLLSLSLQRIWENRKDN